MSTNQINISKRNLYLLLCGLIVAAMVFTFILLSRNESAKRTETKAHSETKGINIFDSPKREVVL